MVQSALLGQKYGINIFYYNLYLIIICSHKLNKLETIDLFLRSLALKMVQPNFYSTEPFVMYQNPIVIIRLSG